MPQSRSKYETQEANYEGETKLQAVDPAVDQVEDFATAGEKLNFRGAHYRDGQPFIVEGDPKQKNDDLNKITKHKRAANDSDSDEIDDSFVGNRYKKAQRNLDLNYGAHFNYKEVIKDCFKQKTDIEIAKYVDSNGKAAMPQDIGDTTGAAEFLEKQGIDRFSTTQQSLTNPTYSQDTNPKTTQYGTVGQFWADQQAKKLKNKVIKIGRKVSASTRACEKKNQVPLIAPKRGENADKNYNNRNNKDNATYRKSIMIKKK